MGNITSSGQNNITSPNGNSLAVFVDGVTRVLKLKDVMGNIQPFSDFVVGAGGSPFEYNANGSGIQPILGSNVSSGANSTVGGGSSNSAIGQVTTVGGGSQNTASGTTYATVGGGTCNIASGSRSTIGGGKSNTASGTNSTIAGGYANISLGNNSFVGSGFYNRASGTYSAILGGSCNNTNTCACAMIVGNNITANRVCATFVNNLSIVNIPTSNVGLPSGSVYRSGNSLCIVV